MNRELLKRIQGVLINLTHAMSVSDKTKMVEAMASLDEIVTGFSPDLPPRLHHFLQQRSYAKAVAWLNETLGTG